MSIMLANFGKYAISDCPFIGMFINLLLFVVTYLIDNSSLNKITQTHAKRCRVIS